MPLPSRPRNSSSGRPSGVGPMSERQQMALLLQMTSGTSEAELSPNSQHNRAKDRNERGETPLHIAAKKGDIETTRKLLEHGVDPNVNDFAGWTPLHEAANHGHYHLAQLLVKHGANVMATGLDDMTPLHDAAAIGNQKLVKMLIDKGADPMFKNKKGKTPQDIAHASLMGFFSNVMGEMANKQQKKTDLKKSTVEEDAMASGSSSTTQAAAPSDIYEFVSTPKHSSCSSGDENPIKAFDKSSLDDKSGTDSDSPTASLLNTQSTSTSLSSSAQQQKRALGDQQDRNDETLSPADEDSKRKKRKDSEFPQSNVTSSSSSSASVQGAKEGKPPVTTGGANRVTSRVGQKPPGPASKTMGLISKGDRKSPCESPKNPVKSPPESSEAENDENIKNSSDGGPKVPPLKIVIPQQQQQQPQSQLQGNLQSQSQNQGTSSETQDATQQGTNNQRSNNKSGTSRNTATSSSTTLPYVLNANCDSNSNSNDKQESSTLTVSNIGRSLSPSADSNKSNSEDSKVTTTGSKSKEPRVTRSSQRGGKDSKDDRSSNNSSPQLPASSTPSPAAHNSADSSSVNESESHGQQASNSISAAPITAASIASQANSSTSSQTSQNQQPQASTSSSSTQSSVELHPRKRKIKTSSSNKDQPTASTSSSSSSSVSSMSVAGPSTSTADLKDGNSKDGSDKTQNGEPVHPHDQPFTNCYQMYLDLRKQIEQRHRNLHPIEPRPLKGLEDYLMNRRTYSLNGKTSTEPNIIIPPLLPTQMKDTFVEQEKERHKLKMKHNVEKEKLVLSKEQEILRVHCKAAQMIANQAQPFSVCTIMKDEEVYNIITPEQEEKYRNKNRERSHGRVFYQALKELDDKWDKIKEAMIIRHTNEAESLHAVQKMDWGWKLKEFALCDYKTTPEIEELHVPMVDVSDEYTTPSTSD